MGVSEETHVYRSAKESITITRLGNRLMTQQTVNKVPYAAIGIKSKRVAKTILKVVDKQYANIQGITHSFDYGEEAVIEYLTIDFTTVSESSLKKIPGEGWLSNDDRLVDATTFETLLLAHGYQKSDK